MRTPTRRGSSRPDSVASRTPSRTATQIRANLRSPLMGKRSEDIPIDPALLAEEALGGEADAEGEEIITARAQNGVHSQPSSSRLKPTSRSHPRRSRSFRSPDPLDSLSPASSTPAPPKKGRRLQKNPSVTPLANGLQGKGKAKAYTTPRAKHHVSRDPICSFCGGTDEINRAGHKERMVSCVNCGRSGHPTCLNMLTPRLANAVMGYEWCCIECKICEVCMVKGHDDHLMFCDGCDRGWHGYCLNPPYAKPPKGTWHCPLCKAAEAPHPFHPPPTAASRKIKEHMNPKPIRRQAARPPRIRHDEVGLFDVGPKIKIKASIRNGSSVEPSPGPIRVRLRVPSAGRKTVEVESEEEKVPYGGIIRGQDADVSKTSITDGDKAAFEKARIAAEDKLGGPPPPLWDPQVSLTSPAPSSVVGTPGPSKAIPPSSISRPLRDRLLQSLADSPISSSPGPSIRSSQKIKTIRFGVYDIDTWYSAPYPEEYQHVPDGRLWLCEFCLKYMKSGFVAGRHRMKCKARHPPGDEIYRDGTVSVFEVDGRKNKIYCQNLCLLAKMFLDHKTLYYDVEPFLFYVMTEVDDLGARFVGYFSKEKRSMDNNVSCIMTLPVRQRKGWGQLLIDFSYLLSKKEGRVGSPEKPLSGLGEVTYKKYWKLAVFQYLRNADNPTMEDISTATSMTLADIYSTLKEQDMIRVHDSPPRETPSRWKGRGRGRGRPTLVRKPHTPENDGTPELPKRYTITWDREYVEAVLRKNESRGHLILRPERLKYHPFLVSRDPPKPPGILAQATLMQMHASRADTESTSNREVVATPADEGKDPAEKVVAGEDSETLALVVSLSASPKRSLRKRASEEEWLTRKRLRSDLSSPVNGRSLRGTASAEVLELPTRIRRSMQEVQAEAVPVEPEAARIEDADGGDGDAEGEEYVEEVADTVDDPEDGDWGDEDAEGEDDDDFAA